MSRKLYVSSDMSVDERLGEVADSQPLAALMWPWLISSLDDWGRTEWIARRIKATVFPALAIITTDIIDEALGLFVKVGLLEEYEVAGRRYLCVPPEKWFSYQSHIHADKRTNDRSKFPPSPSYTRFREGARDSADFRETAREHAEVRGNGEGWKGGR